MSGEPEPTIFDDDFIKGASFTEPSARERERRPGWLKRRRIARAAKRRVRRDRSWMRTSAGSMSAHPATVQGAHGVGVRFDYLFVYPIQRPGAPRTLERLVARVTGEVFYYLRSGAMHTHVADWSVSPAPARCDVRDGFIHPSYDDSAPEKVAPSGRPLDPYDQSNPEPKGKKCFRSTGT